MQRQRARRARGRGGRSHGRGFQQRHALARTRQLLGRTRSRRGWWAASAAKEEGPAVDAPPSLSRPRFFQPVPTPWATLFR